MVTELATYPTVRDEFETLAAILGGKSIARFGDGEFKQASEKDGGRQTANLRCAAELREILRSPHPNCLVGIPTMDPRGPKFDNWQRHETRFLTKLSPHVQYYSSLITRPDSAPWIRTVEYARRMESLWKDQHVVVVAPKTAKIVKLVERTVTVMWYIETPPRNAYSMIDDLERRILEVGWRTILSVGPTATCLANRLAGCGIHAIDIGSAGGFLTRTLYTGEQS
jgi:hypothetical protein